MAQYPVVRRSRTKLATWAAMAAAVGGMALGSAAQAAKPAEVDGAIQKAVAFLLSQQKNGNWEAVAKPDPKGGAADPTGKQWGGETAIATYALLAASQSPQDATMQKAIKWLQDNDLRGNYAVALRSQVWNLIPELARDKAFTTARDRDRDFEMFSRIQKGRNAGFYGYSYGDDAARYGAGVKPPIDPKGPPENAGWDRSNSQYGVLGAWALEQAGAEIPTQYWIEENAAWEKAQKGDGGWNYRDEGEHSHVTYTMTSAGIATLFITQDYVMRANSHQFDVCKGGVKNEHIEKGLAWMDKHIAEALNPGHGGHFLYGVYGIERIGVASGRKYFGTVNWFDVGSEALVRTQHANGSWGGSVHDTCFGLLFLARGRAPVMMNKLIYENTAKKQNDPWNERPRDVANLSKWMGKHSLEGFLNWQLVNLKVSVDDLHDAPILYISGSEELNLSNQDVEKLRTFVEQGGMILGNADCDSAIFSTTFKKLGGKLFPKYEFRKLPTNHPIYNEQYHANKWKVHPLVEGMTNGVRELMVLIPNTDPGRAWQAESTKTRSEMFELAGNIFLYATDKQNLHHKGETYIVHDEGPAGRVIPLARIEAGDNWDPEPGAWRRMSAIMHNEQHVDVKPEPVKLGDAKLDAGKFKVATLTGTTKLMLTPAQRDEIKNYVTKGGTLIVDAAGGSTEFATSAEDELKAIFGDAGNAGLAQPLPPTDPVFNAPGKLESKDINYRTFARATLTGGTHDPRVRAIKAGTGRVFYSREDLTGGLVGELVDGILGYTPETSVRIMRNLVMSGAGPK